MNQSDYVGDLLGRFEHVQGEVETPCLKEEEPAEEAPNPKRLKEAQTIAGALQWVTTRSRPDIAFAVNKVAQLMSRFPEYSKRYAENILRYLRRTQNLGLRYEPLDDKGGYGDSDQLGAPRAVGLLEVFADASFAPKSGKSQTGVIGTVGGGTVAWISTRQSVVSLSTAESELYASGDGLMLIHSVSPLLQELMGGPIRKLLYSDSASCASLYGALSGAWRTRHLRLKAKAGREQLEQGVFEVRHLKGQWMLGDVATKALDSRRLKELCMLMKMDEPAAVKMRKLRARPQAGLEETKGFVNTAGIQSAMKLLMVSAVLERAQSKFVITVEENHESRWGPAVWAVTVITVVATLAFCAVCCRKPKDQAARATRTSESEDEDWSVVDGPTIARVRCDDNENSGSVSKPCDSAAQVLDSRANRGSPNVGHFTLTQCIIV